MELSQDYTANEWHNQTRAEVSSLCSFIPTGTCLFIQQIFLRMNRHQAYCRLQRCSSGRDEHSACRLWAPIVEGQMNEGGQWDFRLC